MDAVGHVTDWHVLFRPAREERLEETPAHRPVQAADAVDSAAPADRQVRHVELLRGVVRVPAAEGQQVAKRDAKFVPGVAAEVLLDEGRREAVEPGGHRGVGGEEVAGPRDGECDVEGLSGLAS